MSELLVKLFRYSDEQESFFTECVADALRQNESFRIRFVQFLFGAGGGDQGARREVRAIETQVNYPGSCVDMVLRFADGSALGVEHKLWSPEGPGQLAKYLDLPLNWIAFVTGYTDSDAHTQIVDHPKYLSPRSVRPHFMWHDFQPLLEESSRVSPAFQSIALLSLFRHLGFEPPPDSIPDLWETDLEARRANRLQFALLWHPTEAGLRARGWRRHGRASHAGLEYRTDSSPTVKRIWLDSTEIRGSLRLRFTVCPGTDPAGLVGKLERSPLPRREQIVLTVAGARRASGREEVVDVMISLRALLGDAAGSDAIAQRLADHTLSVVDAVC